MMAKDRVLLVEGTDDLHVAARICGKANLPQFCIVNMQNVEEIINSDVLASRISARQLKVLDILS